MTQQPRTTVLHRSVLARLNRLDEMAEQGEAAALVPLARTEIRRLTEGWRMMLDGHRPDDDGRCPCCSGRWRRKRWPCLVWLAAHQHLMGEGAGSRPPPSHTGHTGPVVDAPTRHAVTRAPRQVVRLVHSGDRADRDTRRPGTAAASGTEAGDGAEPTRPAATPRPDPTAPPPGGTGLMAVPDAAEVTTARVATPQAATPQTATPQTTVRGPGPSTDAVSAPPNSGHPHHPAPAMRLAPDNPEPAQQRDPGIPRPAAAPRPPARTLPLVIPRQHLPLAVPTVAPAAVPTPAPSRYDRLAAESPVIPLTPVIPLPRLAPPDEVGPSTRPAIHRAAVVERTFPPGTVLDG